MKCCPVRVDVFFSLSTHKAPMSLLLQWWAGLHLRFWSQCLLYQETAPAPCLHTLLCYPESTWLYRMSQLPLICLWQLRLSIIIFTCLLSAWHSRMFEPRLSSFQHELPLKWLHLFMSLNTVLTGQYLPHTSSCIDVTISLNCSFLYVCHECVLKHGGWRTNIITVQSLTAFEITASFKLFL